MATTSIQMGPVQVALLQGRSSWGSHDTGYIEVPMEDGLTQLPIVYDEREAPQVPDDSILLSLSDEGLLCACAWVRADEVPEVAGIGVDLASPRDFCGRPGTERFIELMFSARERELAATICPDDPAFAFAVLFGAKEAAFKATARPLRMWYREHTQPLEFEVRDFGMETLWEERGELRHGAAQVALNHMAIPRIQILHTSWQGMALVVALAYR